MKFIILLTLIYTIYLNNQQTNLLNNANNIIQSKTVLIDGDNPTKTAQLIFDG